MSDQPGREIISIEADEKRPDDYGLERFMEEVNILELEGYYFCPNRTETKARASRTISLQDMSGEPVKIAITDYGAPGEGAYRVLQGIFLKLSEQGPFTEGRVYFSWRELLRLLGMSQGGRQAAKVYRAIKQLQRTEVACSIRFKEKRDGKWIKKWRAISFTLISRLAFEGSARGRFSLLAVDVDAMVVRNFQNRHISYFNWERMRDLDMVAAMLYKRFFRHLANIYHEGMDKNALKLEKDYEQVCTTWLNLKPYEQRSRIEKQLKKHLEALKRVRLLRECRIEPKADGSGFKIVGYAGAGFFHDYESIYRRALAPPGTTPPALPLSYVADFHRTLGHDHEEFTTREVSYARELLTHYGADGLRSFIQAAIGYARETNFAMHSFGALSVYEARWNATRKAAAAQEARELIVASCAFCNDQGLLEFADGTAVMPCPHEAATVARIHEKRPLRDFFEA
jgi:hypothetical protein